MHRTHGPALSVAPSEQPRSPRRVPRLPGLWHRSPASGAGRRLSAGKGRRSKREAGSLARSVCFRPTGRALAEPRLGRTHFCTRPHTCTGHPVYTASARGTVGLCPPRTLWPCTRTQAVAPRRARRAASVPGTRPVKSSSEPEGSQAGQGGRHGEGQGRAAIRGVHWNRSQTSVARGFTHCTGDAGKASAPAPLPLLQHGPWWGMTQLPVESLGCPAEWRRTSWKAQGRPALEAPGCKCDST